MDLTELKTGLGSRLILAAENLFAICFNQYRNSYIKFMSIIQDTIITINDSNFEIDNFTKQTLKFDELKEDKNRVQKLKKELDEMYELLQQSPVAHVEDLEEKHAVILPKWYKYITYLQSIGNFRSSREGLVIQQLRGRFLILKQKTIELLNMANQEYLTRWNEQPQENKDLIYQIEHEFLGKFLTHALFVTLFSLVVACVHARSWNISISFCPFAIVFYPHHGHSKLQFFDPHILPFILYYLLQSSSDLC